MQSSVSSQPSGFLPMRPMSSAKPPTRSKTSRRNDMLQPMRLRTSVWYVGWPVYVQPTIQSSSPVAFGSYGAEPGSTRGRLVGQRGWAMPPTAATVGSEYGASRAASQPGRALASSSRKTITSPVASATAVLRAPDRPCFLAFGSTRTPAGPNACCARASSAALWSTTTIVSAAATSCAATDSTAATMSSHRFSVYTQITTDAVTLGLLTDGLLL